MNAKAPAKNNNQFSYTLKKELQGVYDIPQQKKSATKTLKPRAGCMKGTFTFMSDDFNDELEDFRDYQ
jgi:hypothetical protein